MTSLELISRTLGSLSDDLAKAKNDINNIIIDIEMLKRALIRLDREVETNNDKQGWPTRNNPIFKSGLCM